MQMTLDAQKKVAVQEALAGRIMQRLEKLAATEEREMRQAFAAIPARVYETTLQRLASMNRIRKVGTKDGIVFVAKAKASKQELAAAAKRYRAERALSEELAKPETRHFRYSVIKETTLRYADPHPLTDDAIPAHLDADALGAASQEEHFGLSYEYAQLEATHEEAQRATQAAQEPRQILVGESRPMAADKKRLVEIQLKSGQGFRNAKRAQRRYFAKPENELARRVHEHAQAILAEEKAKFEREA